MAESAEEIYSTPTKEEIVCRSKIPECEMSIRLGKYFDENHVREIFNEVIKNGSYNDNDKSFAIFYDRKANLYTVIAPKSRYPKLVTEVSTRNFTQNDLNQLKFYQFKDGNYFTPAEISTIVYAANDNNKNNPELNLIYKMAQELIADKTY